MGMFSIPKPEFKFSPEEARKQFLAFLVFYQLDLEKIFENNKTGKNAEETADEFGENICEEVQAGRVEFLEKGRIVQHLETHHGEIAEISYGTLTGLHRKKLSGDGTNDAQALKAASFMAEKSAGVLIDKMTGVDMSVARMIGMLFLMC